MFNFIFKSILTEEQGGEFCVSNKSDPFSGIGQERKVLSFLRQKSFMASA
jgi:hypothetical protein